MPIFRRGDNFGVAVNGNTTNVPFRLEVLVPANHPLGDFTCTLVYSGTQRNPVARQTVPIPTKGNDVQFKYRVKNKFVFLGSSGFFVGGANGEQESCNLPIQ